ncbi:hypothetical protein RHSIM_Rhsim06G0109600 [Rhododendron simsii]|uniref:Uncharacterized protein n=1 Tax=Rhododendron simsii TaxID=118357 RepID=A0A834GRZ3_RHOSS|nr:hypothetical protein RHSIM_Rhsim06G0109600 [Rhododendron simsii]
MQYRTAKRLNPIKNINRNTKNWAAKVKYLENWNPRSGQHSPVKYQKLILANEEKNRVQTMIYLDNIKKLEDTLEVYNTYLISIATVKFAAVEYRTVDFEWQWTIDASTLIQTFDESASHEKLLNIDFIPFEQFGQYVDKQATVDILAAVAQVHTPKVLNKPGNPMAREIIIINQGLVAGSMTVTIFENHAKDYFLVDGKTLMKYAAEGLKALEGQAKSKNGRLSKKKRARMAEEDSEDAKDSSVPIIHIEEDMFILVDDVLLLLKRAALEPLPLKDDKGP